MGKRAMKTNLQKMIELWEGIAELHRQEILSDKGGIHSKIKHKMAYVKALDILASLFDYQSVLNLIED